MNELSLFTGIGGGVWASKLLGHRVVGYVEINDYCQKVIRARIDDGNWDEAPIFNDIQTFNIQGYANGYSGLVDLVSGGFPCQDLSVIGTGLGLQGSRSGLWADYARTIELVKPKFVFIENVPALLKRGLNRVLADLSDLGFDARWCCLSAAAVGAEHIRKRLWILGYAKEISRGKTSSRAIPFGEVIKTREMLGNFNRKSKKEPFWFLHDSYFTRGINDVPDRINRATAIGNAQVPRVAATAFRILSEGLIENFRQ